MTREQAEKYVARGGAECPRCRSVDLYRSNLEAEGPGASATVRCWECGEEWYEIYHLANVATLDGAAVLEVETEPRTAAIRRPSSAEALELAAKYFWRTLIAKRATVVDCGGKRYVALSGDGENRQGILVEF